MRNLTKLIIFILLLNVIDIATTLTGLSLGASEANTIWGPINSTTLFFKVFFVSFLCVVLYAANFYAFKEKAESVKKFLMLSGYALNVIFFAVAINNVCVVIVQSLST